MRSVVLSHRGVADELGHIGDWLSESGYSIERIYREDSPSIPDADLLVVLGSPTSVAADHCQPPAAAEIEAARSWLRRGRPYLGVCFGAQVLAQALGGSVRRMDHTYRAFVDFEIADGSATSLDGRWAVWHEDAITAPSDSTVLARLPHADVAFRQGNAVGVQPHVEFTSAIVERLGRVVNIADDEWRPLFEDLRANEDDHARRSRALLTSLFETV